MVDYPQEHLNLGISQSALKVLHRSPRDYWWCYIEGHKAAESEAMRLGTAMHCAVLEPRRWDELIAVAPKCDRRTTAGKAAYAAWEPTAQGKTIVSAADAAQIMAGAEQVLTHPIVADLLRGAEIEKEISWTDRATGVKCRGRPDAIGADGRVLFELKKIAPKPGDTLESCFQRQVQSMRYDVQLAFYRDGLAEMGRPVEAAIWCVVEENDPYLVALYAQEPSDIEGARFAYRHDLELFKACCQSGKWPGLEQRIKTLRMAKWAADERAMVREGE